MAKAQSAIHSQRPAVKRRTCSSGCSGLPVPGEGPSPGALTHAGEVVLSPARQGGVAIRGPAALGEGAGFLVSLQPAGQRTEVTHSLDASKGRGNTLRAWFFSAGPCSPGPGPPSWAHAHVCPLGGSRSPDKVGLRSPKGTVQQVTQHPWGPGGLRPWWLPPGCAWVIATCTTTGRTPSALKSLSV